LNNENEDQSESETIYPEFQVKQLVHFLDENFPNVRMNEWLGSDPKLSDTRSILSMLELASPYLTRIPTLIREKISSCIQWSELTQNWHNANMKCYSSENDISLYSYDHASIEKITLGKDNVRKIRFQMPFDITNCRFLLDFQPFNESYVLLCSDESGLNHSIGIFDPIYGHDNSENVRICFSDHIDLPSLSKEQLKLQISNNRGIVSVLDQASNRILVIGI
jgi:hypothetical protein